MFAFTVSPSLLYAGRVIPNLPQTYNVYIYVKQGRLPTCDTAAVSSHVCGVKNLGYNISGGILHVRYDELNIKNYILYHKEQR